MVEERKKGCNNIDVTTIVRVIISVSIYLRKYRYKVYLVFIYIPTHTHIYLQHYTVLSWILLDIYIQ